MIKAILTDFSHVLLFAKDPAYTGKINTLYDQERMRDDFSYWSVFELNEELCAYMTELNKQLPVYIFTTGTVQTDSAIYPRISAGFSGVFAAQELGLNKKEVSTYLTMCEKIGHTPDDVLYIDDKQSQVDVASAAGLHSFVHHTNEQTVAQIQRVISQS